MHYTDPGTHANKTDAPNKARMLTILKDKHLQAQTIALLCIHYMTDEQVGDMMSKANIHLLADTHEVLT